MPVFRQAGQLLHAPRLPRLGIIRLGYKETRARKDGSEYTFPKAAECFVLTDAPAVAEVYGEAPTVLEPVYLPVEDEEVMASHYYRFYTKTWGLTCKGTGLDAQRMVDQEKLQSTGEPVPANHDTKKPIRMMVTCPCPLLDDGQCRETLFLQILLPNVPGIGVWQIGTSSVNSIRNLQGSIAMIRAIAGRVTDVPLKLSLVPQTVVSVGRGGQVTIHVLQLDLAAQGTPYQLATAHRAPSLGILPPPSEIEGEYIEPIEQIQEPMGDPTDAPVESWESVSGEGKKETGEMEAEISLLQAKVVQTVSEMKLSNAFMRMLIANRFHVDRMAQLSLHQLRELSQFIEHLPPDDPMGAMGQETAGTTVPPTAEAPSDEKSTPEEEPVHTAPESIISPSEEYEDEEDTEVSVYDTAHALGFASEHIEIILGQSLEKWLKEGKTIRDAKQALGDFYSKREENQKRARDPETDTDAPVEE